MFEEFRNVEIFIDKIEVWKVIEIKYDPLSGEFVAKKVFEGRPKKVGNKYVFGTIEWSPGNYVYDLKRKFVVTRFFESYVENPKDATILEKKYLGCGKRYCAIENGEKRLFVKRWWSENV